MFDCVWGFNNEKPFLQNHICQENKTNKGNIQRLSAFNNISISVGFKD